MNAKQLLDRITINPEVMVGKPTIRGLRITDVGVSKKVERWLVNQGYDTTNVRWKMLGKKVSYKWDNISVIEEINQQREKSW